MIRSASCTEVTRWAIINVVVPASFSRSAWRILLSVAVSTALVLSSKIIIFGFFNNARAIHSRCFCPPDTLTPPCPRSVSYPSGKEQTKSCACAARQASSICSSVAPASPQRRFSLMVPEKSTFFCNTIATALRKVSSGYSRTSRPPTFKLPLYTSYNRGIS